MRVLYHLTVLPPQMPGAEALTQEISVLRRHWPGELVYLNPNPHIPIHIPRLAFGFHRLRELRRLERTVDIHHLYNPDPFPFSANSILAAIGTSVAAQRALKKAYVDTGGADRVERRFLRHPPRTCDLASRA